MNPITTLIPFLLLNLCGSAGTITGDNTSCNTPLGFLSKWKFINNKHWVFSPDQGISPIGSTNCPKGDMVEVQGNMIVDLDPNPYSSGTVEYLQKSACKKWINKEYPERCSEFDEIKWTFIKKTFYEHESMHFCIDPFEWPNQLGAAPWIMVTWNEAKKLCELNEKRLCTEKEWTFACEGEEALPYPYGYTRNINKCNIDKPWKLYSSLQLVSRGTEKCGNELARLWQGDTSGKYSECVSPFGVYDMTGNIDEWTISSRHGKYPSILKGGYWGPVRNRCRPSTRNHAPNHAFYQQGFRCCADLIK